jgi:hypothetical protein
MTTRCGPSHRAVSCSTVPVRGAAFARADHRAAPFLPFDRWTEGMTMRVLAAASLDWQRFRS